MVGKYGRKARKIRTNDESVTIPHPYSQYELEPIWPVINQAITDLVSNGDLEEKTARNYIVGYICKLIGEFKKGGESGTA